MASYSKVKTGWRAQVAVQGVRESKTFTTKAEAIAWATARETEIRTGKATGVEAGRTVGDAITRYKKEVSASKRGHRFEALRLATIGSWMVNEQPLRKMRLVDATSEVLGKWRNHRLNVDKVNGSTVNRELNLLSSIFTVAAREWKWIVASPTEVEGGDSRIGTATTLRCLWVQPRGIKREGDEHRDDGSVGAPAAA